MSESTMDDPDALYANYAFPQGIETDAADDDEVVPWTVLSTGRKTAKITKYDQDQMPLADALEQAENKTGKTVGYNFTHDDIAVVVIKNVVHSYKPVSDEEAERMAEKNDGPVGAIYENSGKGEDPDPQVELEYDIDLSPWFERGLWVGVDTDCNDLIIPIRKYQTPDWLSLRKGDAAITGAEERFEVYEAGYLALPELTDGDEQTMAGFARDEHGFARGDVPRYPNNEWIADWLIETFNKVNKNYDGSLDGRSRLDWVSEFNDWHEDAREGNPNGVSISAKANKLATLLKSEYEFLTLETEETGVEDRPLMVYNPEEGTYQHGGVSFVQTILTNQVGHVSTTVHNRVLYRLRTIEPSSPDTLNAGEWDNRLLCVRNGVVDVEENKLLPHSPEYKFTTRLDVEYDPDAEAEHFERFLADIVGSKEDKLTLEEWIGFCLAMDYPIDRFLVIVGDGGNGKSIYLDAVQRFLGEQNVSHVPLQKMAGSSPFGLSNIEGKLLNIDSDTTGGSFYGPTLDKLKKLTTSGDKIQIERKHESAYSVDNTAKIIMAANKPPRLVDESNAIPRRLLWVNFPFDFVDDPQKPDEKQKRPKDELMAELTTDEEMSGILNIALAGLRRVLEEGQFSNEKGTTVDERYEEYLMESDDIAAFGDRFLERHPDRAVPKDVIFDLYVKRQKEENARRLPRSQFWAEFDKIHDWMTQSYPEIGDTRKYIRVGVDLSDHAVEYLDAPHRDLIREMYYQASVVDFEGAPHWAFADDDEDETGDDAADDQTTGATANMSVQELADAPSGFTDLVAEVATEPTTTEQGVEECKLLLEDAPIRLTIHAASDIGNLNKGDAYQFEYVTVQDDENGHVELVAEDIATVEPVDADALEMSTDVDPNGDEMNPSERDVQTVVDAIDDLQTPTRDNLIAEVKDDVHPSTIDHVLDRLKDEDAVQVTEEAEREVYYI